MNKRLDFLLEEILEHDFDVQQEDGNICLISNFSPCGQDCNASIDTEDDAERFVENIREYANDFDVSYETYLWLDDTGHGKNGAPYDMKDVYEDMQWWKDSLQELADTLENALNEYDNSQEENL